jgi:hypothetical protein
MFKENWQGGFIDYTAFDAADETWHHRLDEQKPLLLVFDYAENHGEEVAIVLTRIATHKPKKVRILLLARSAGGPGGWWDQLRMKRIAGDVIKGPATQELVRLKSVAQTLPERVESHRQAQVAFAKRLNKSDYKPQLLTEPNLSQSCFERVLLLHMNALALVEGSEINGAEEILDYVLNRERRYWSEVLSQHQFAETNIGFEEFEQAMVLATFVGGIDKQADLHKAMRSLPCFEKLGPDEVTRKVNALFPLLHDCYGGGKWIDPVQPDLLGQRLFDRAFHGNDYLKKKIFVLVAKLACK